VADLDDAALNRLALEIMGWRNLRASDGETWIGTRPDDDLPQGLPAPDEPAWSWRMLERLTGVCRVEFCESLRLGYKTVCLTRGREVIKHDYQGAAHAALRKALVEAHERGWL
jgi:hypothetical protein